MKQIKIQRKSLIIFSIFSLVLFSCIGEDTFTTLKVTAASPANHAAGLAEDTAITVSFNNAVNKSNVENKFSLSGPGGPVDGAFTWNSKKSFTFTPRAPLKVSNRYVIELDREAEDADGNKMSEDFVSDFYIGTDFDIPVITASTPAYTNGGTMNVAVDQSITVSFSEPMDRAETERAFSITPEVSGYFQWSEATPGLPDSQMTYVLTSDMEFGVQYQFSVSKEATDLSGNAIAGDYTIIFITGDDFDPPYVEGFFDSNTIPATDGYLDPALLNHGIDRFIGSISPVRGIAVNFSEPMDKASTQDAFYINPPVNSYHFRWYNGDTQMIFVPEEPLKPEWGYTIGVRTTAKDANGRSLVEGVRDPVTDIYTLTNTVSIFTDAVNSLNITVGKIEGTNTQGGTYGTVLYDITNPALTGKTLAIDMGAVADTNTADSAEQDYYFRITFVNSNGDPVDMAQASVFSNWLIKQYGKMENSPNVFIEWDTNTPPRLLLSVSGLSNNQYVGTTTDDPLNNHTPPTLYVFTLLGEEGGLTDQNGNYMQENFIFQFQDQ